MQSIDQNDDGDLVLPIRTNTRYDHIFAQAEISCTYLIGNTKVHEKQIQDIQTMRKEMTIRVQNS